jgi:hypothetical protein
MLPQVIIESGPPSEFDSHLTVQYLEKYGISDKNVFVETGTYLGETVKLASKMGFNYIHSVELDSKLYYDATQMFQGQSNITIWLGDSPDCLGYIVRRFATEPITFWLDAHASGPLPGGASGGTPVLDELRAIKKYSTNNQHTIFIDDRRLFGSGEWSGVTEAQALELIKEINPDYKILYLDGHVPGDVICATIRDPDGNTLHSEFVGTIDAD